MSEISIDLQSSGSKKPKRPKRQLSDTELAAKKARGTLISSIIIGSIAVHVVGLILFGLWTVAQRFNRPEAKFEMKKTVKIPPKTPEHKMNVARHEAMTPKPTFSDKLVSTRPIDFALPEMPEIPLDQMLPLDPSELISDQVNGLVGSAALGSGMGSGMSGGGGTGSGMSFFGVKAQGDRILLLFDVSSSVVNKAEASGVPLERIQTETIKLIETLPISSQFSLVQFTGNYMPFTDELVAATPGNKETAAQWVEDRWVTAGTMSSSTNGVVSNLYGLVGVLEKAVAMRPDVVFLISDASFQWRLEGGIKDIPYRDIAKAVEALEQSGTRPVPLNFLAFEPKDDDIKEWRRIIRRTGGEFRELKAE
ncbi:MAG: hypothetical protein AAF236_13395 [Verrucomicrobiota bacterium]